jgi:hypothetical protein
VDANTVIMTMVFAAAFDLEAETCCCHTNSTGFLKLDMQPLL